MACLVSDIVVSGIDDGAGGAASITVRGRAEDCDSGQILVKLFCGDTPVGSLSGAILGGAWSVTFDDPPCICGQQVRVEAECEGSPGCRTIDEALLVCQPPEGECPALDGVEISIGECIDGLREVTFTITTNAAAASVAEIEFGDGGSDAFVVAEGMATNDVTHAYAAGVYAPSLGFLLPEGCPLVALDAIDVPPCCLRRDEIEVAIGDCVNGLREVTFGFPGLVAGSIDFGDGEQAGFAGLRQTHRYPPRDAAYRATVTLDGCDPLQIDVEVETCPLDCLEAGDVTIVVGEACDNERRRSVTLIFPRAIQAEVDFGDGSDAVEVDGDQVAHDYPARVSPTATYAATVTPADDCAPLELRVEIPACPCIAAEQVQVAAADDCDAGGNRTVTFTLPWQASGEIDYGDGQREPVVAAVFMHTYTPGDDPYRAVLTIPGCGPIELDVAVAACGNGGGGGGRRRPRRLR